MPEVKARFLEEDYPKARDRFCFLELEGLIILEDYREVSRGAFTCDHMSWSIKYEFPVQERRQANKIGDKTREVLGEKEYELKTNDSSLDILTDIEFPEETLDKLGKHNMTRLTPKPARIKLKVENKRDYRDRLKQVTEFLSARGYKVVAEEVKEEPQLKAQAVYDPKNGFLFVEIPKPLHELPDLSNLKSAYSINEQAEGKGPTTVKYAAADKPHVMAIADLLKDYLEPMNIGITVSGI